MYVTIIILKEGAYTEIVVFGMYAYNARKPTHVCNAPKACQVDQQTPARLYLRLQPEIDYLR